MRAPKDDLIRGLTPIRAAEDGNTMAGYPVVFDAWTEIHSWEGDFLERIGSGALTRTLKQNGDRVRVEYNHGMHPVVGTSGLGRPRTMKPDSSGLYTETPLSETSYNRDIIKPQLADGTLAGMSFRFAVVAEEWVDPKRSSDDNPDRLPERTITELKLYEFGPVDYPAYEATTVGIRSAQGLSKWLEADQEDRQALHRLGLISEPRRLVVPGFTAAPDAPAAEEGSADPGTPDPTQTADPGTCEPTAKRLRRDKKWQQYINRKETS